jgi:hypothetical protein
MQADLSSRPTIQETQKFWCNHCQVEFEQRPMPGSRRGFHNCSQGLLRSCDNPPSWAEMETWLDKLETKACQACGLELEYEPGLATHVEQCDGYAYWRSRFAKEFGGFVARRLANQGLA